MQRHSYDSNVSMFDLLFIMLLGFVSLFIIAFIMINKSTQDSNIKTKAEFVVTVTWDLKSADDVDTWLLNPNKDVCFFRRKDNGLLHLDRDDLGSEYDTITMPDGTVVKYDVNQEILTIRGVVPGTYTLNIHMYNKNTSTPTNVTVTMDKLNPRFKRILQKTIVMNSSWEEVTIIRFTLDRKGNIIDSTMGVLYPFVDSFITSAGQAGIEAP